MRSAYLISFCVLCFFIQSTAFATKDEISSKKTPVDYVNPYIGNISHILAPTYPTVHLPNSMLRVYPIRKDFTTDLIDGLPVVVTTHRGMSSFRLSPISNASAKTKMVSSYTYDREKITPYRYSVHLEGEDVDVDFAPSHQSAIYNLKFPKADDNVLVVSAYNGHLKYDSSTNSVQGYEMLSQDSIRVYLYMESDEFTKLSKNQKLNRRNQIFVALKGMEANIRYGVSFISVEQAKKNLRREIDSYDIEKIVDKGRTIWNEALSKILVDGGSENDKTVFYTSLYRTYERMINISEDGKYFSAFDHKIHDDGGILFYTDDWIWDTYKAAHPLRILIDEEVENQMIVSFMRMAQQSKDGWMPTFPGVTGDSHVMNGNHFVGTVLDAYMKGLRGFDVDEAYRISRKTLKEKSFIPWRSVPKTELDVFYDVYGYFPALREGEKETVEAVHSYEKRQSVAVTLAACYDDWSVAQLAKALGKDDDYKYFIKRSFNYRNLFNSKTGFFHPKDKRGQFIEPFDYTFAGGQGARDYYDENNAWIYRWDLAHNFGDLVQLMGSPKEFEKKLDQTFQEPLGKTKFEFYTQLPDHTGNVGQFAMGNEPSLHIPYLYNYCGAPWKTQKRVRKLLEQWFRNDLMGMPGDEDGGGLTSFVVFSAIGFYPVTPGMPSYNIGSPLFENIKIKLSNDKIFEIEAKNCSNENKYIQSASLNGKVLNKPWFSHDEIKNGGKLVLDMGSSPNKSWGASIDDAPPSAGTNVHH